MAFLATRFHQPVPRPNQVNRPRLIDRLQAGLAQGHRLTLVSAPAGFGKTTLVSAWLNQGDDPVVWLSLDEADNDPAHFLSYLIAAFQNVQPELGRTAQTLLQAPQMPPLQHLMTLLLNDLAGVVVPLVLVLDDYQVISAPPVHDLLTFFVEHQPPPVHLVLTTREDPPLPLPRMRVRGQVTDVRERDLRFTPEETATFLNQTMNLDLDPAVIAALEARTEGWVAGLQLAALAVQEHPEQARAFVSAFTGDDRYVMDYLMAEVLERQPEPVRAFLRQTALLDRLTASLCDALTGRSDSQMMLEQLDASNLFVIPLDHRREWYRYHRLFAEFLRATLTPDERARLHQRAAQWYEAQNLLEPAVQHTLASARLTGDYTALARLVTAAAEQTLYSTNLQTIRGWLNALPDAHIRTNANLAIYRAWFAMIAGDIPQAEDFAEAAEDLLQPQPEAAASLGRLRVVQCHLALGRQDYPRVIVLANEALHHLPDDTTQWRLIALWLLAEIQERTRPVTEAIESLRAARRTQPNATGQMFDAILTTFLAIDLNLNGQRRAALNQCEQALGLFQDEHGRPSLLAGVLYVRTGMLLYEANELARTREFLTIGQQLCEQMGIDSLILLAAGALAALQNAEGDSDAALATLRKVDAHLVPETLGDTGWLGGLEASLHLSRGEVEPALRWAEQAGFAPDSEPEYLRMEELFTYARLLIVRGQVPAARALLARMAQFTEARGFVRWQMTIHILQALAAEVGGEHAQARRLLAAVVQAATPEGYVRAFLDTDARVLDLLPAVRLTAPAFVDTILNAAIRTQRAEKSQPLDEPLSERELEVLGLIAAGLTNAEIAERLVITVGTVKRHINHLYGKLAVGSRTQAVVRARALKLIAADDGF